MTEVTVSLLPLQFYLDKTRPRPSTYQVDFKQYGGCFPDCVLRREQRVRDEGLDKRFFLYHHNGYKNELISWYDEHYNQRERPSCQRFPVLRSWNGHQLGWRPEKNDHPIQGKWLFLLRPFSQLFDCKNMLNLGKHAFSVSAARIWKELIITLKSVCN